MLKLLGWIFGVQEPPPSKRSRPVRRATAEPATTRQRLTVTVSVPTQRVRNTQALYEERGWRLRDNVLHGWCRTRRGAFQARIDGPFDASPRYSLINPPKQLLDGPHGGCFRQKEANRFEVHWNTKPADVNAGILQLEHILFEALR